MGLAISQRSSTNVGRYIHRQDASESQNLEENEQSEEVEMVVHPAGSDGLSVMVQQTRSEDPLQPEGNEDNEPGDSQLFNIQDEFGMVTQSMGSERLPQLAENRQDDTVAHTNPLEGLSSQGLLHWGWRLEGRTTLNMRP